MSPADVKAAIAAASAPPPHAVEVPGLGTVHVRVLTPFSSAQSRRLLKSFDAEDDLHTGRVLALVLCDEQGELLYDPANAEDAATLARLPAPMSEAIFNAHRQANGVVATAEEATALGKA